MCVPGDDDLENIVRMGTGINELLAAAFPEGNPLEGVIGDLERMNALKLRLLEPDVVLCVNDKCHLFSWAGDHCEKYGVATLNLCPSQHEIQRQHAGVMDEWRKIFANVHNWPPPPPELEYTLVRDPLHVPRIAGLYVTYRPLIANEDLIPEGREVVGPVYMGFEAEAEQNEQLQTSGLLQWLDNDPRPVVYVSLGSMIRNFSSMPGADDNSSRVSGIRALFQALLCPSSAATCRVLTTIPPTVYKGMDGAENVRFCSWVPQFAVLGHPRVAAFVSHCGANSVHEAIYHAVPIIAVPFFDDQRYNAPRLVQLGLAAASLSKEHMTEEQVTTALALVLHNHDIRDKMVAASEAAKKADGLGRLIEEAKKLINYSVSHPPS
jgi:hypothetical protein